MAPHPWANHSPSSQLSSSPMPCLVASRVSRGPRGSSPALASSSTPSASLLRPLTPHLPRSHHRLCPMLLACFLHASSSTVPSLPAQPPPASPRAPSPSPAFCPASPSALRKLASSPVVSACFLTRFLAASTWPLLHPSPPSTWLRYFEAEARRLTPALANGVIEAAWLRQLLQELHNPLSRSTFMYRDNISAIYLSTNSVQHQRTKHVKLDLHFICEQVDVGDERVHVWITSRFADIFIKSLPTSVFEDFRFTLKHLVWLEFQL